MTIWFTKIDLHPRKTEPFDVFGKTVIPIEVMHYKLPVWSFRFGDFTYITDANSISEEELEKIKGSKILVVNALQREPHISHFTLNEAIDIAQKIGPETAYFSHISHNLGLHEEVSKELPSGIELSFDGLTIEI